MTLPMTISPEGHRWLLCYYLVGIRDRLDPKKSSRPLTLKAAKVELKNIMQDSPALDAVMKSRTIKEAIQGLNSMLESQP